MKRANKWIAAFLGLLFILTLLPEVPARAAEEYGDWEFEIISGKAEITSYNGAASTLSIPSSISGYTVTSIGEFALSGNSTLTKVTIPDSVTVIKYGAFEGCEKLKTVVFGTGLKTIEDIAFRECPLLTGVTFKEGILSLGDEAFMNTGLTSVTIPKSLTSIDGNPFANCSKLKSFTVTSGNGSYTVKSNSLYTSDGTMLVAYPTGLTNTSYTVPSGTATVGISSFGGAENLTSVTIPSSVKVIKGFAFSECYNLKSVSLPSGLTTLGNYAFSYCSSLTTLAIPASTESVGYGVATESGITSFTVASGNTAYSASGGVLYNKAQTKLISYPAAKTAADFTAASKVTATEEYAFVDCWHLSTISLPGLKTMGEGTFSGCSALKNFEFPSTMTKIPDSAFEFCSSLKSVTIPAQITSIGGWAYYMCENLTSVKIPTTVKTIGESAFAECSSSLKISCESGSAAHTYAKNEGIAFVLTDIAVPKITTQPTSVTVANGNTATFKVVATGVGMSYQWQYSADNGKTWKNTSFESDSATVSMEANAARNGLLFHCVVKNGGGSVTSSAARLTVSGVKPAIRLQPTAVTAATGSTATFKIVAAGTGLSYQWQYSADNGSTWHNTSFASNSATVSMEAISARNGLLFHCVVKNAYGSATSASAKLTVMAKPAITTQPTAVTVANGKTATFKVVASGTGLSYQWQYSADNGKTWKTPSFTSNKATISMAANEARNGLLFHCVVKNAVGSVTSSAVRLTVSGVKPAIRLQPTAVTAATGSTATFKIVAAGTGLSYQWQYSSDGGKTWHNTSFASNSATVSMTATAARNGLLFHCVVKNAYGSATSSPAKLTVQ